MARAALASSFSNGHHYDDCLFKAHIHRATYSWKESTILVNVMDLMQNRKSLSRAMFAHYSAAISLSAKPIRTSRTGVVILSTTLILLIRSFALSIVQGGGSHSKRCGVGT
jgi:hypothetical protein